MNNYINSLINPGTGGIAAHETDNGSSPNANAWWTGDNISGYADAFSDIWDSIKGQSQPDQIIIQQPVQPLPQQNTDNSKTWLVLGVIVALFVLVVVILKLSKKK